MSESIVIRNVSEETITGITSAANNLQRIVHDIGNRDLPESTLKLCLVIYIDILTQIRIYLIFEDKLISGEITSLQMQQLHQAMIIETLVPNGSSFVESALKNTNLIVNRRVSAMEAAYKKITGRNPY